MRILFVCTGNLCRSPMAEALLKELLARRGCDDVEVSSAGTWAGAGNPASDGAVAVLGARGIDLAAHRSRPLDRRSLHDSDLVIVMTSVHVREVLALDATVRRKLFLIKELPELGPADGGLDGLYSAARPEARRSLDLDDPIGLPLMAYERCVREIEAGIHALADRICKPGRAAPEGG